VERHREKEIGDLQRELREQKYRPQAVKRVWIEKLGSKEKRPLGIPAVRDRIVQGALRHVIEPIFEREFAAQSYGFRPGRGCKAALRRVEELLKSGHGWVVDADLKSYFDTIPHGRLMERVGQKVADGRVLALIEGMLKAGVMEAIKGWQPTENGTPQGAVISPLLSNIYLNPLDWLMAQGGYEMVRIGVGAGRIPRPSLRTGLAELPHPALRSAIGSFAETGEVQSLSRFKAKQPKFGKVAVCPALVIQTASAAFSLASFSQDASEPASNPAIGFPQRTHARVAEVSIPSSQDGIDLRDDRREALSTITAGVWLELFTHLRPAFRPHESTRLPVLAPPELVSQEVEMSSAFRH
jgi:hypothetical protein